MKLSEIHIRDPFILIENDTYYMYGTNQPKPFGFYVYKSTDLENFEKIPCFTPDETFWAQYDHWAPEVHKFNGAYYMFASFRSETRCRGTAILKADSPEGPFVPLSDGPVTPEDWVCLDGTLYVHTDGTPYMVFCHEWVQVHDGEICYMKLTPDLSAPAGEPVLMFKASENPYTKEITGKPNGVDCYGKVTDGPYFYRAEDGRLIMIWSSMGKDGYIQAQAISNTGDIFGLWNHTAPLIFNTDGGHGMIFKDLDGNLKLTLHSPNKPPLERAAFFDIKYNGEYLEIVK